MVEGSVAVFGASGFVGQSIVERLRRSRIKVSIPRSASGMRIDVSGSAAEVKVAVAGSQVIINAAGRAHSHSTDPADFWPANCIGARNVARAAATTPGVQRLIHVSSAAVGAGGLEPPATPNQPFTAYGASKAAGELAVAAELAGSSVELFVVRPAGIGGADSPGAWGQIRRRVASGRRIPVPDVEVLHDVVEIDEVTEFLFSATLGDTQPGVHMLPGPRPVTITEYVDSIARSLGVPSRTIRIPRWALTPVLVSTSATERTVAPAHRVSQLMSTVTQQRHLMIRPNRR